MEKVRRKYFFVINARVVIIGKVGNNYYGRSFVKFIITILYDAVDIQLVISAFLALVSARWF